MQQFMIRSPNPLRKGASEVKVLLFKVGLILKVPLFKEDLGGSRMSVHDSQIWWVRVSKLTDPPYRKFIVLVSSFLFAWAGVTSCPVLAANLTSGTEIFQVHCAGCHLKGGNIVRRNKTLKLKALERNRVNTLEAIASLVAQGKNNMPAYGDRLSPDQIQIVSKYVLEQAEQKWR
jgi:cytochrome c6